MSRRNREGKPPIQTRLKQDDDPPIDLSCVPNDADDKSDADLPTTDHQAEGWRELSPSKP
jgi:hypothetical protein